MVSAKLGLTDSLPANIDAERFVLGSIFLDGERVAEAPLVLEDFSFEAATESGSA